MILPSRIERLRKSHIQTAAEPRPFQRSYSLSGIGKIEPWRPEWGNCQFHGFVFLSEVYSNWKVRWSGSRNPYISKCQSSSHMSWPKDLNFTKILRKLWKRKYLYEYNEINIDLRLTCVFGILFYFLNDKERKIVCSKKNNLLTYFDWRKIFWDCGRPAWAGDLFFRFLQNTWNSENVYINHGVPCNESLITVFCYNPIHVPKRIFWVF